VDRTLLYIFLGLLIIGIFTFKPVLLIRQKTFKLIAAISALELAIGVMLHFTPQAAGALLAPLPTLDYFRLCLKIFLNIVHHEPIDVAYNWNPGLFKDRVFSSAFVFGGMFILAVATLGMEKLAKAGWWKRTRPTTCCSGARDRMVLKMFPSAEIGG
jgi:hypothetical protein